MRPYAVCNLILLPASKRKNNFFLLQNNTFSGKLYEIDFPYLGDVQMSEKKKDLTAQSRREDEVLNRTLLWIGGAAILILFLLFVNRYFIHYRVSEISLAAALNNYILPAVAVIALVGCIAGILLAKKAAQANKGMKWFVALALLCGGLVLCAFAAWKLHEAGVQFMCAAIPAVAVLALVYYLFQREFFLIAVAGGISIAALWTIRRAGTGHAAVMYGALVVALALLIALALISRKLQAAGGLWNEKRILSKNAAYLMIYATCAVMAVLLLAAAVAGSSVAYYLMFPAVGWLIVMAVYFTVKLM